ncbi:hypothetical protein Gbem_0445 [Citrifermentans bemidjiense Bem]|uniref:DUF1318 domain-containing protein n=1 Tax=Citrifermentans bemidjiense (strain ATCC BAA-1014 / DSM 16622 / JCM 12645 / Bem) TaxID=404380 RepID=B5EBK5_CITBB|nr:hypothetical protein Gbem_0445 [Citrifermentans bemidjiense Bem]
MKDKTRSTFNVQRSKTETIKAGSTFNVQRSGVRVGSGASLLLLAALLFGGCTLAKVDVNVVSERTSLENQVLGTYNALSEDVLLVASVRGVSPTGKVDAPQKHSPEHQEAAQALEAIAFHADDVDTFKRLGWVGESLEGTLAPFERALPEKAPADLKAFAARFTEGEFKQVVDEVNRSREILMLRVVRTNENFTAKDLPAIRKVFARINRQNSAPGTRVQGDDGKWVNQ